MIRLSREDLRLFRSLWRRCQTTIRPPSLASLRVTSRSGRLAFLAEHPHGLLGYVTSQPATVQEQTLPGELLDLAERTAASEFDLQQQGTEWHCTWGTTGETGAERWPIPEVSELDWPRLTKSWSPASGTLLPALRSASEVATIQPGRWATNRLQIQGESGRVIATDTRQLLIQNGFQFPFPETVLIPTLPIFSAKQWRQAPAKVALQGDELQLRVENWLLTLRIDSAGRFPDCLSIVPRSSNPARVQLSEADVRTILQQLPSDSANDKARITFDLQPTRLGIRCLIGETIQPVLWLRQSTVTGSPMQATLEAKYLRWGLQLGLRSLQLVSPEKPLLLFDSHRQFVVSTLPSTEAVPDSKPAESDTPKIRLETPLSLTPLEIPMSQARLAASGPKPDPGPDLLDEAEIIRGLLLEVNTRLSHLIQQLKTRRKTERALNQVVRSLQALPLPERG
jgi:hypothetical protein